MRPIKPNLKKELASDPFYKKCCLTGRTDEKIDWHHNLIFAGRQVNEKFAILPLAESVHHNITQHKQLCDWVMTQRATDAELKKFSKAVNLTYYKKYLQDIYGTYNPKYPRLS